AFRIKIDELVNKEMLDFGCDAIEAFEKHMFYGKKDMVKQARRYYEAMVNTCKKEPPMYHPFFMKKVYEAKEEKPALSKTYNSNKELLERISEWIEENPNKKLTKTAL